MDGSLIMAAVMPTQHPIQRHFLITEANCMNRHVASTCHEDRPEYSSVSCPSEMIDQHGFWMVDPLGKWYFKLQKKSKPVVHIPSFESMDDTRKFAIRKINKLPNFRSLRDNTGTVP